MDNKQLEKLLKSYLSTSIKNCSSQIDECEETDNWDKRELLRAEKSAYDSVLNFINTFKEEWK